MSLKQKKKKIKHLFHSFILLQIILIIYLFTRLYFIYNRGDKIVYQFDYFDVDFRSPNNQAASKKEDNFYITASKNGIRYYYAHCSGVGRINLENRVYFDSKEEAEGAGYTLAKNCEKR